MTRSQPPLVLPKLILTDIDGVWTDGGMYYDQTGSEWKKFNTSDSAGVLFARSLNIPVGIITGEDTPMVAQRAKKLDIELLYQGVINKVAVVEGWVQQYRITWDDVAYIGDDLGDWRVLERVGFAATPQTAPSYIQSSAHYVTTKRGGEGAFREFVEWLIERSVGMNAVLNSYR